MKHDPRDRHVAPADPPLASGLLLILMAVTIWGTQFPIAKATYAYLDPFHLSMARYCLPAMVLVAVLFFREGPAAFRFDQNARFATTLGLIGMCGSPALVFGGLSMTRPEIAAIIVATQPAMTAVVLWVLRGERPETFSLMCIAVAFAGVFTVVTRWNPQFIDNAGELVGGAMILTGALCWVVYTIGGQRLAGWSILRVTALTMLPGALGHVALTLSLTALGVIVTPALAQWQAASWHIAYLACFGVLAAMLMWNAGTKRIGPLNAMLFQNLIPVVTFGVRYWQGHRFTAIELFGAALVIAALAANNLALQARHRASRKASNP